MIKCLQARFFKFGKMLDVLLSRLSFENEGIVELERKVTLFKVCFVMKSILCPIDPKLFCLAAFWTSF